MVFPVIIGYRDEKGFLKGLETIETLKIPSTMRSRFYWDQNACLTFADVFLSWIKSVVVEDDVDVYFCLQFTRCFRYRTCLHTRLV